MRDKPSTRLRAIVRLGMAISVACCVLVFSLICVTAINLALYGRESVAHNAGAKFAIFVEGLVVGVPLCVTAFLIVRARQFRCP